jgi:Pentapeptide repeats (8 copies)
MSEQPQRPRPAPWAHSKAEIKHKWATPFFALEYVFEWFAFFLSNWTFLHVVNYLRTFGILVAVIFYFSESGDRLKQKHYQAWQVINTAQGKGGNGGRIDALQELNEDKVPLVGVDVSGAFLQGLRLEKANLARATLNAADVRNAVLPSIDFSDADLRSANFRDSNCRGASFRNAILDDADFSGADLSGADLSGAALSNIDLRNANLQSIDWQHIASIKSANIAGVKNAPEGFVTWGLKNGAVQTSSGTQ